MIRETCGTSKMSMAVVAGYSDLRGCARPTGRAIAPRLVTDVRDVTRTRLITTFTHILLCHGTCKVDNHIIMAFDIVIKNVKSLRGVYLTFEHYIVTAQTVIYNYLIMTEVFLKSH